VAMEQHTMPAHKLFNDRKHNEEIRSCLWHTVATSTA
jgi:hypothetical protein